MHVLNLANAYLIIKDYSKNKQFDVHEQFGYLWCSIAILVLQKFRPKASRSNSIVISFLNQICMYMPITAILNLSKWSLFFGPLTQVTKVYIIISYQYYVYMTILCTLKWLQDSCVTCIFTGETNWTGYWRPKRQIYLERTAGTVHQGSSFLTSASRRWPRCRICRGRFTMSSTVICRKREE